MGYVDGWSAGGQKPLVRNSKFVDLEAFTQSNLTLADLKAMANRLALSYVDKPELVEMLQTQQSSALDQRYKIT